MERIVSVKAALVACRKPMSVCMYCNRTDISSSISIGGFGGRGAGRNEKYVCSPERFRHNYPERGDRQIIGLPANKLWLKGGLRG